MCYEAPICLSCITALFQFPYRQEWGRLCCVAGGFWLCLWISAVSNASVLSVTTSPRFSLLALVRPVPGVPDGTDMTTNVLPDFFAHPCSSVWGWCCRCFTASSIFLRPVHGLPVSVCVWIHTARLAHISVTPPLLQSSQWLNNITQCSYIK